MIGRNVSVLMPSPHREQQLGCDANPGVGHRDFQPLSLDLREYLYGSAARELQSISYQVEEHLLDPIFVGLS